VIGGFGALPGDLPWPGAGAVVLAGAITLSGVTDRAGETSQETSGAAREMMQQAGQLKSEVTNFARHARTA
jgi:hypothetical protein